MIVEKREPCLTVSMFGTVRDYQLPFIKTHINVLMEVYEEAKTSCWEKEMEELR